MADHETLRLSRLTAILTLLQSKRVLTAQFIAQKFNISVRTVYRDIKALEDAGIPICREDGKGYSLLEGYSLPPIMFTETEANALITAEQWVLKNKDASFVKNYTDAITKIKALLKYSAKDKAELLSKRIFINQNFEQSTNSNHMATIQLAITNFHLLNITYQSPNHETPTSRLIEPLALYSTYENWVLIAFCRLRNEMRSFRLDRILQMDYTNKPFEPTNFSMQAYFESFRK